MFLVGNHSNQFVDGLMFLTIPKRNVFLLMAEKSLKRAGVGWFGSAMRAIPVRRPQDEAFSGSGRVSIREPTVVLGSGTKFLREIHPKDILVVDKRTAKVLSVESDNVLHLAAPGYSDAVIEAPLPFKVWPYIEQQAMYEGCFRAFSRGACVGLFPEGGSHDRGQLISLKAGVALMAFAVMEQDPNLEVPIVPCGLNYFQGHRFHGRCVMLFGKPLLVTRAMFEEYKVDKHKAVDKLLRAVQDSLYHVVLEFPDHRLFRTIQTLRNLFKPDKLKLTGEQEFRLMYQFKILHNETKNDYQMKEIEEKIHVYHALTKRHGITGSKDWERSYFGLRTLFYILALILISALALIPAALLNLPVGLVIRALSLREKKRAKAGSDIKKTGSDVVASHKILMGFFLLPVWYVITSMVLVWAMGDRVLWTTKLLAVVSLPVFSYLGVVFTEQGLFVSRKIKPLFLRLLPSFRAEQDQLKDMRKALQARIRSFVFEVGDRPSINFFEGVGSFLPRQMVTEAMTPNAKKKRRAFTLRLEENDIMGAVGSDPQEHVRSLF